MKILILRFSSMGDIVMLTPVFRALRNRFPDAQLDLVTLREYEGLVGNNPHLHRIYLLDRTSGRGPLEELATQLRSQRYNVLYDAHRSLRSRYLMARLQAPQKFTLRKQYLRRTLKLLLKLPVYESHRRMSERHLQALGPLQLREDGKGPEVVVPQKVQQALDTKLDLLQKPPIVLVPSAQWPGKRWPWFYFRALLQLCVQRARDPVRVLAGPNDSFVRDIVAGFSEAQVTVHPGEFNLLETAALLHRSRCVIANDTGLAHLSDAVGAKLVLLLGPTSGNLGCLPWSPTARVVEQRLWCRPCSKNGQGRCIRAERYCLTRSSPESVWNQIAPWVQLLD